VTRSLITTIARQSWLSLLCCSAIATLGCTIVNNPTKSNLRAASTLNFPQPASLKDLQQIESKSLPDHQFKNKTVAIGRQYRYRYQQQSQPIDIQVRYITDGVTNQPAMERLLPAFTDVPATVLLSTTSKQQPNVGDYSLFVHKERAYLSTCINPQGMTTVTADRFHANSNPNPLGLPVNRLLPWLLGQQTLRDSRCIWTVLSTPIDRATPDATMKTLETIGVTWIHWWQVNYPAV
jgi:cyanosortase A-associated protein